MRLSKLLILIIIIFLIINASLVFIAFANTQGKHSMHSFCTEKEQKQSDLLKDTMGEYFTLLNQINQWLINHFFICFLLQK